MAQSVNKVVLIGRLGKDPIVKVFESGDKNANFSLATSESFTNREGQKIEQTEWHNIVLRKGLAEVAEKYLKKGELVYVEGKIKTREYTDKDGQKKRITEIIGENMTMLGSKREAGSTSTEQNTSADSPVNISAEENDDLPF
jgi:single-strand DNA-binding protein